MKKLRKLSSVALALLAGAPAAAQAPAVAVPVAAPPPPAAVAVAPAAVAAPTRNLWTFLLPTPAQKAACKAKFCGSQFGQLINNTLAPASALTGGVIPQPCPGPVANPANLLQPPDTALGAAARIEADTAAAAARRAAVRYLGTVDCNWWDQASAALVNALRADKNECVRMEAALALQRGCCCNPLTIKGLVNALSAAPDDGNPVEDSPRVRAAAMAALDHCLACYVAVVPAPPPPPPPVPLKEGPPGELPPVKGPPVIPPNLPPPGPITAAGAEPRIRGASYAERSPDLRMEQVVQEARRVLQKTREASASASIAQAPIGSRSLCEVIQQAMNPSAPQPAGTVSSGAEPPMARFGSSSPGPSVPQLAPQLAPTILSPRPKTVSAVSSPPRMAPTPVASAPPVIPARSGVWQPTRANLSYAVSAAPLSNWVPVPPAPPASNPKPTPAAILASALPVVSSSPIVSTPAASSGSPSVPRLLLLLLSSTHPDTRERAAQSLASRGEPTPLVVQALASSADADVSADVRLACLRGLLQLHVADPVLPATVTRLQADVDPRVREAANELRQWLQSLSAAPTPAGS